MSSPSGPRVAAVLSTLVLVGAVLLFAAHRSPAAGPLAEWLRFLPYPFVWLAVLPALVHAWLSGRRLARGLAAIALIAAVGLAEPHFNPVARVAAGATASDAAAGRMRLMTYNAKAYLEWTEPGHLRAIAAEVRRHRPDVVVMQDAIELIELLHRGRLGRRSFGMGAAPYIHAHGQYLVVSRWPLRDCRAHALPPRPGAEFLACTLQVPQVGDVPLLDLHLLTPRSGLNAVRRNPAQLDAWDAWRDNYETRVGEGAAVAAFLDGLGPELRARALVGGDFNAVGASPIMRRFAQLGLRDAFAEAGNGLGHTIGHALRIGVDLLRIDHVLAGRCWQARRAWVGARDISEHRAVIADLQWDRGACPGAAPSAPQPQLPM